MKLCRNFRWKAVGIISTCLVSISPVGAQQIAEDGTISTRVTSPNSLNFTITEGERAGGNLFHSFRLFSIPTGGSALFDNSLDVENIISRVTGGSASQIDGLIRSNGSANLFLLNPNGIIFGPNARLDIGGSFLASTASAVNFADGSEFSATTASSSPLLTISVPIGLQYGATPAGIQVQGATLAVQPDRTLVLIGGDITMMGGHLSSESGWLELGAVGGAGTVELAVANNQIQFNFSEGVPRANVLLTNGATVDASGSGGGDIQLFGRQILLEDSRIESTTLGSEPGGNLSVNATESVELIGNQITGQFSNGLFANTNGTGSAGNLSITTGRLTVRGEARISAATFGVGQGGNVIVNAAESVELIGVDSNDFHLFTGILTDAESTGAAGDLAINTRRLLVRDGAQISAATFGEGAGGKLTVNATESVELIGVSPSDLLASGLFTAVQSTATGKGGDVEVNTRQLIVRDGAQIFVGTLGTGDGGNLAVNASESVEVSGVSPIALFPSGLFSTADDFFVADTGLTVGNAGDLMVNTRQLIVRDGGQITTATIGNTGQGGNLTINALESVEVSGKGPPGTQTGSSNPGSALLSSANLGFNNSGTVRINTEELIVQDEAQVAVSNAGLGNAGDLEVNARSIFLDNQGTLSAATASGEGGNILLRLPPAPPKGRSQQLLLMRHNSLISAEAGGTANGGNIEIDTPLLVALENSDIVANAKGGFGGKVTIQARAIFGTEARRELTPESDITASSAAGPQFDGVVDIQTPDVDVSKGIITLPEEVVDIAGLIAQGCGSGRAVASSRFVVTGRGGSSPSPGGTIPSEVVLEDLGTAPIQNSRTTSGRSRSIATQPIPPSPAPLVEAQGWVINSDGQVVLTAQAPTVTPHSAWVSSATCNAR